MKTIMKLSVVILTLSMIVACHKPIPCIAQQNAKTNFKIVLTADSHGLNSWPLTGGYDSIWFNKIGARFRKFYDTVTLYNSTLAGGRTIGSVMPMWYSSPYNLCDAELPYSIDSVLKFNADLIIISMSGNHTVNHMPADEAIYCYKYLIDTLNALGKSFIIGGQNPRQKTFTSGMTLASYYDSCTKINNFLISYAPNNYIDTRTTLEDTVFGKRPWPASLCSDSLHFSDNGNDLYTAAYMKNYIVDSCLTDFRGFCTRLALKKQLSNLTLSGFFRYRTINVYGSNDYINYTLYKTYKSGDAKTAYVSNVFTDAGYTHYKIEAITGKRKQTRTFKNIN